MYKLLWFEPGLLLLFGLFIILPGMLVPLAWHFYLLSILFTFWLFRRLILLARSFDSRFGINLVIHPLTISIALIVLQLLLSVFVSVDLLLSYIAAGYLFFGIALFDLLLNWSITKNNPLYGAFFLLLIGIGLALVSPPLVAWKPEFRLFYLPLYGRLTGIPLDFGETIHANVLAGMIVLILPILFSLTWQRFYRFLVILLFLFVSTILVLTQSRAGYLAIAVALTLVVLFHWHRFFYSFLPVVVVIILFVQRVGVKSLLNQLSLDDSLGGWEGRLDIWNNSLLAISDFAFTGIGIGTFTVVMPLLYPLQVSVEEYPHAHNLFLQVGLDLGLPGLIAYLAMLIILFVMLISTLRNPHTLPLHRTLAIGATGSLVGMLVHGLLDAVTWGTKLAFVPWILFALITQLFLYTQAAQAAQAAYKASSALPSDIHSDK